MEVRLKILALFLFLATIAGAQGVTDTCDYLEGGILERQMQTGITGLLRGSGYCIQRTTVNGGLEMVGATLSVVDGDTTGQVLRWNGTTWVPRLIIFPAAGGGADTVVNGLTDVDTAFILGGPLVQHTTVTGQQTYDFFLNNMRNIALEGQRTGGVAYTSLTMGSTALQGVDFFHVNEADPAKQAVININYSTGNVIKIQETSDNGTGINQYDPGDGAFRTDIYAANAVYSQTFRVDRNGMYLLYPDIADVTNEACFLMLDTLTYQILRKSPADFAGLYGDDWGSQVVEKTARFSGSGTAGSPLELAQQSATSGQVLKWSGTAWAPGTDSANAPDSTFAKGSIGSPSYAGKTLGSAVFRTGRTGFKTANTTGVLNISPGFETGVPAISIPDSCERVLQIAADSRGDSLGAFVFHNRWFDNASEVGDNQVAIIGYNTTPGGGKIESGKAGASLRIEEKYDIATDGNKKPSFEFHLPQINFKTGTGNIRPLTGIFGHEQRFGGRWQFAADDITFLDYKTGTQKAIWGFATNGYTKGIDFQDTAQLRFQVNNWNIFSQKKAGSGFVDVIKVNASDEILIGGGGETRTAIYNHLRLTNGGILSNENGEIYIGNTTYPTRVILENNTSNLFTFSRTGAPYTNTLSMFGDQFYYQSSSGATPFKVFLGAPSNSLLVNGSGFVGIGQGSPTAQLHVLSSAGTSTTKMLSLENLAGTASFFRTNVDPQSAVTGNPSDFALSNIAGDGKAYLKRGGTATNTGWGEVLTNTAGASGTTSYLPKFTSGNTIGNSAIYDDGSANIMFPWGYGAKIQYSGSYYMGVHRGSGRDLELYAVSADNDADITLKPGGGVALTAKNDGKIGIATTSPAQTFHVAGTARITGSDGTATTIMGRDGDGDISDVDISDDFTITSGELRRANPGEATYSGANGATGETVVWQPEDVLVVADPTAGHLTINLNTSMKQGLAYSLFGGSNLTYNIILNSGTIKLSGSYGTTSSYTLGAGEHLEVIRLSTDTFYISKK